jgi:hypothetical protein
MEIVMPDFRPWLHRLKVAYVLSFTLLPIAAFYLILFKNAVRIPILDDYDIVLHTISWLSQHPPFSARLGFILNAEHNGYKLMFDNAVIFAQYLLWGQVHFLPLVILGNLFALFIFLIVLRMARVSTANPVDKWLLLTPVAWLIFQLQYASALDFSSCSLQNLGVVFFALLSIYLLDKPSTTAFTIACLALVFAIASSPSGFFTAPVGFLLLAQKKRWKHFSPWVLTTTAMLLLYLYHYTAPPPVAGAAPKSSALTHLNLFYALSFMGSSAARFSSIAPAVVLGLILCAVVLLAIKLKYFRSNPPVFYAMLLIMINALAVSGLRSDLGLAQSLASRYRIYSNLFLVFTYLFVTEAVCPTIRRKAVRCAVYPVALTISVAFCCLSDLAGARFLHGKKQALTFSYRTQWQGRSPAQDPVNTELQANPALLRQISDGIYDIDRPALLEAVHSGVYTPPQNP